MRCGKEVTAPAAPAQPEAAPPSSMSVQPPPGARPKPAPKSPGGRCWLFGACGTAVGAILLAAILLIAGVFSAGGQKIEGPGFASPEDAAKAYLEALRDQDVDAMLSTFAVESYVAHYDLEAMVERLKAYMPNLEIRLPNTNEYNRQLNIASRRNQLAAMIVNQYIYYNAPDALSDGAPIMFEDSGKIADFIEDLERDTGDYVFADLEIGDTLEPEDVSDMYMTDMNLENIARQAKTFGADEDDVANVAITFEADGEDWVFCPQAVRYDGKWYLQSAQGNLAILANMTVFSGGIAPVDMLELR
jgi:hypothetical protein